MVLSYVGFSTQEILVGSSDLVNMGLEEDAQAQDEVVVVGRKKNVEGSYLDTEGKNLFHGGGSIVVEGNENRYGAGHNSAYTFNNEYYMFFHAYDAMDGAKPKLKVKAVTWDQNQWPNKIRLE